jgi:hypothetical protein
MRLPSPTDLLSFLVMNVALISGCTKNDPLNRGATVTGKVTLDGVPLGGGVVVFESPDGRFNPQSVIRVDGTYIIQEPPLGPCNVSVKTSHLKSFAPPLSMKGKVSQKAYPGFSEEEVGYFTAIPIKYENATTSGLNLEVVAGDLTKNLELTSK